MTEAKEAERIEWNWLDIPGKIKHIMWRFVMVPEYNDEDDWRFRITYDMEHEEWYCEIGSSGPWGWYGGKTLDEAIENMKNLVEKKEED